MTGLQRTTGECIDILTELESWYARESGQHLLRASEAAVAGILDTAFGYHLLQIGCTRGHPLYRDSPINHRIYMADRDGECINLLAAADELPLESDSVDTVIAHHSLDFAPNPHQVLREIQRVLTPQGQLLVIGVNPYSLLGVSTTLRGLNRGSLWHWRSTVSQGRLTDWLHLLGCEVEGSTRVGSVPVIGGETLRRWLGRADQWGNRHNLPIGGLYIVHAIKHVPALRRPRRQWRLRRERLFGLLPRPAPAPSPTPFRPVGNGPGRHRHHRDPRQ